MKRFEKHVFICENKREEGHPRGCCSSKSSLELKKIFKEQLKTKGLNHLIRANSSGCLDACEFGPAIVIYPEQTWYGNVSLADVDEIIESHLIKNVQVERLKIKDKRFNKDEQ